MEACLRVLNVATKDAKENWVLKGTSFFLICGLLQTAVMFGCVYVSCQNEFDCEKFIPTISYLAAYRGYDRVFTMVYSFYAVVLLIFFLSAHANYKGHTWTCNQRIMMTVGVMVCFTLPAVAAIDEMSSSYLLPLDLVHKALISFLCFSSLLWVFLSLCGICSLKRKLKGDYNTEQRLLVQYILICILALFIAGYIWMCQFYNAVNWMITDYNAALAEWLAIVLAVFLPYSYALSFPMFEIAVAFHGVSEKREN